MKKRTKILLALLPLVILIAIPASLTALVYWQQAARSPARLAAGTWLVAGPFRGNGDNGLYRDYLSGVGESLAQAREGDIASWGLNGFTRWQQGTLTEKGVIELKKLFDADFKSVAYAYTEIESDSARRVVATIGSGTDTQIRVNGQVVYESRLFRKTDLNKDTVVFALRKGINPVLVKVQRGLAWDFQWKVVFTQGSLFVNEVETIIPDFRATEPVAAWAQVEVANVSGNHLAGVKVEIIEDEIMNRAESDPVALGPEEAQRIPVWIAGKKAVAEGETAKVRVRVTAGEDQYSFEAAPRVRKPDTSFVTTYRSSVDGSVQPYSVLLPPSFDQAKIYPMIILLHGSHVTAWGGNITSYAPKEWAIQVAVHDRGNNYYRDIGEVDINEVLTQVTKRYKIDPDRLFLSGHSMGGYGTWFLAARYPDRWAAISPQTAYSELALSDTTMTESANKKQQEFQSLLLQSWSPIRFAENLSHIPAYMMHGAKDLSLPVAHSRRMCARLDELSYEHIYDENPEGGHWWGARDQHKGTLCVDKPEISDYFLKHNQRAQNPRLVIYKTDTLRYRHAYWVTINEMDTDYKTATVRAEIVAANNIAVQLDNITELALRLNAQLVDRNLPVTVSVNGQIAFNDILPASLRLRLRRDANGNYARLIEPDDESIAAEDMASSLIQLNSTASREEIKASASRNGEAVMKSEQLYGPIIDAFNKPFLLVVGTKGAGEDAARMHRASRRAAQALRQDWMTRANGIARMKTDSEITPDDIATYNLVLFGNSATNSLIDQINDSMPIRFAAGGILAGERVVAGRDLGMIMIRPNPLNKSRYVVIFGGTTPLSMETAARLRVTDLPDYVLFDFYTLSGKRVEFLDGGFFDKRWQIRD